MVTVPFAFAMLVLGRQIREYNGGGESSRSCLFDKLLRYSLFLTGSSLPDLRRRPLNFLAANLPSPPCRPARPLLHPFNRLERSHGLARPPRVRRTGSPSPLAPLPSAELARQSHARQLGQFLGAAHAHPRLRYPQRRRVGVCRAVSHCWRRCLEHPPTSGAGSCSLAAFRDVRDQFSPSSHQC